MIWNTSLTLRTFCTFVAIACCSGCTLANPVLAALSKSYENHVDLSDSASEEVATIRGETHHGLIVYIDCFMTSPASAKRVTVNAGIVDIEAECTEWVDSPYTVAATFRFEALAGHQYVFSRIRCGRHACFELLDATSDEVVVKTGAFGVPPSRFRHKQLTLTEWDQNGNERRSCYEDNKKLHDGEC